MFGLTPITLYLVIALAIAEALTFFAWRSAVGELRLLEAQAAVVEADNKRQIAQREQITEDTKNGWKAALDATRRYYDKRLRAAGATPVPGVSGTASVSDDAFRDAIPPAAVVAEDCAFTTLQLNQLQDWINKQERVK